MRIQVLFLNIGVCLMIAVSVAVSQPTQFSMHEMNQFRTNIQPSGSQTRSGGLKLIYGISFGAYFANSSTANYYNGSGEHSVDEALNRIQNRDRLISNTDEIIAEFEIGDLPLNMRYDPAPQIGFYGGLMINKSFGFFAEFNYARLTAADKFTIFTDKFTSTSEPYRLLSDIYGIEERIDLRAGVLYIIFTNSYIHPFIESGINLTDVEVIENRVVVSGMEFNIREIRSEYYGVRDYGIGFGMYTGVGLQFDVSDHISFKTGFSVSYSQINLGDNNSLSPLYTMYLRLNLNDLLAGKG